MLPILYLPLVSFHGIDKMIHVIKQLLLIELADDALLISILAQANNP